MKSKNYILQLVQWVVTFEIRPGTTAPAKFLHLSSLWGAESWKQQRSRTQHLGKNCWKKSVFALSSYSGTHFLSAIDLISDVEKNFF